MRILIIEDEKLTARDLAHAIRAIEPDADILPFLHSVEDALFFFEQERAIDLIFSDIELGDGRCFEILERINQPIPVIFCTAYEEYTLQTFRYLGIDYILKPFHKDDIAKALSKYKMLEQNFVRSTKKYAEMMTNWTKEKNISHTILIHQADKIFTLSQQDIAFFVIESQQVLVYTFGQKRYPVQETLEVLEQKFGDFFRVNRQFLLNRRAVKEASQYFHRKLLVHLHVAGPEPVIVSRLKVNDFLEWLTAN